MGAERLAGGSSFRLPQAQGLRDGGEDERCFAQGREVDEYYPVGEAVLDLLRRPESEARLANAAYPREREQPRLP